MRDVAKDLTGDRELVDCSVHVTKTAHGMRNRGRPCRDRASPPGAAAPLSCDFNSAPLGKRTSPPRSQRAPFQHASCRSMMQAASPGRRAEKTATDVDEVVFQKTQLDMAGHAISAGFCQRLRQSARHALRSERMTTSATVVLLSRRCWHANRCLPANAAVENLGRGKVERGHDLAPVSRPGIRGVTDR